MPGKTLTDLTDELLRELITLKTQFAGLRNEVDQAELAAVRARVAVLESMLGELKRVVDEHERRGERLAVLESQHAELRKQLDERDRRWWQFWVGAGLVGLTFVANLLIQLFLLFSRKPG
jgi:predicted  nucleic acid-binding Zn-ribbon protein